MELKFGDIVAIRHYSTVNTLVSHVLAIDNNYITLKLTKDFSLNSLFEGEPLVIGYEDNETVFLLGCDIVGIDSNAETVLLELDSDDTFPDKRRHERFPISLYADIIAQDSRKKYMVIIKDMSEYGMLIYSKSDFPINALVEIDVYTEKEVVFIKGHVIRKEQNPHYNKYGLLIRYENLRSIHLIENYLKKIKISYSQQISKTKADQ